MRTETSESVAPPACPAAPTALLAFCCDQWNATIELARWEAALLRRERVVRGFRAAGDPRAADALGWLSAAGVLAKLPARMLGRVLGSSDPAALTDAVATARTGDQPPLCAESDPPPGRFTTDDGLEVIDAGSRSAWKIADLAGRAARGEVVAVGGHPMTPSTLRILLRDRVRHALDPQGDGS